MPLSREDRILGCLLGGAIGDAIGSVYEGCEPKSDFSIPTNLFVSDDTQLTLATCDSIIENRTITPENVARHFVQWYRERRISGIGSSTLKALTELDAGGHWALVGANGDRAAGNGAAMRIAPLAFFLDLDLELDRRTIRDICRITHRNDEAYVGALAILGCIRHALHGKILRWQLIAELVPKLPDSAVRDRLIATVDSDVTIEEYARRFGTTGYVVDSVPLAILAASQATDFLTTISKIVPWGGDSDTILSMFGQIYGAAHGTKYLPTTTLPQIDLATQVRNTALRLASTTLAM